MKRVIVFLVLLTLAACARPAAPALLDIDQIATQTAAALMLTPTQTATASPTHTYTPLPTSTQTQTPLPSATIPPNHSPKIDAIATQICMAGQTIDLPLHYSDPDSDPVTVAAASSHPALAQVTLIDAGTLRVICGKDEGMATVALTVEDGHGLRTEARFIVEITQPNRPPIVVAPGNTECFVGETLALPVSYSDPDGDAVEIRPRFSNGTAARADMLDLRTVQIDCVGEGISAVTLAIADGHGGTSSADFTVTVRGIQPPGTEYIIYNDQAEAVLALVNQARAEHGLNLLTLNPLLTQAALAHNIDMVTHDFVEHTGSNGSSPGDRATAAGYRWVMVGENIAAGMNTPEEAFEGWKSSPGHWENIIRPEFTEMGLAYVYHEETEYKYYWTQTFGRPR